MQGTRIILTRGLGHGDILCGWIQFRPLKARNGTGSFWRKILNKIILEWADFLLTMPLPKLDTPSSMTLEFSFVEMV